MRSHPLARFLLALKGLLIAVALTLAVAAPTPAAVKVFYGFHENFPPFSYLENGQPAGFEVELLQAAMQGSEYVLQPRPMNWESILISLNSGGVHVASGMVKTQQREQAYLFTSSPSIPLFTRIFQNTQAGIQNLQELNGAKASVKRDSLYQYDLERLRRFDIQLFDSQKQALEALWDGGAQLTCTADKIGYHVIQSNNFSGLSATGEPLRVTFLRYALRRDQRALRDAIDKGLERLRRSGVYDRIYRKWFVPELDDRDVAKLLQMAKEGADKSYVPYSLKPQGAAVSTRSGRYYAAGVIENGDPKLTQSALAVAVQKAASQGDTDIRAAVSLSADGRAIPPTANDRRLLYQFGRGVLVITEPDPGEYVSRMITELLPYPEQFSAWKQKLHAF